MPTHILKTLFLATAFTCIAARIWAHVPYFENNDFSAQQPFAIEYSIEQSLAIYAWLEKKEPGGTEDIDVFVFQTNAPTDVYLEVLVPVCRGYEEFLPWFALVGPGLPASEAHLPFDIPSDYGIVVIQNMNPGEPRDKFYEFFGGKSYYKGPGFNENISRTGTYYVFVWDPLQKGGDYVAVFGKKEIWRFRDIMRALRNTPLIRLNRELHVDCSE